MAKTNDLMTMYRVAKYYYVDELSQTEIADVENISRPQISRILKKAKENGIVSIQLKMPKLLNTDKIAKDLTAFLGLRKVVLAPSSSPQDTRRINWALTAVAAEYLSANLKKYRNIGLGWGETVYQTSLLFPRQPYTTEFRFVPLIANSGSSNRNLQTTTIVDRFSEKCINVQHVYINQPLYADITAPSTETMHNIYHMWDLLEVAVIGAGGLTSSPHPNLIYIDELGYARSVDLAFLMSNCFGDILAHFFLNDGSIFQAPAGKKITSIDIEKFKTMKEVICIASGFSKTRVIKYIAECGYIKTLITDVATALEILKQASK
jgi:DNA-binding transcriptional regulator LsrR (DeoR family)